MCHQGLVQQPGYDSFLFYFSVWKLFSPIKGKTFFFKEYFLKKSKGYSEREARTRLMWSHLIKLIKRHCRVLNSQTGVKWCFFTLRVFVPFMAQSLLSYLLQKTFLSTSPELWFKSQSQNHTMILEFRLWLTYYWWNSRDWTWLLVGATLTFADTCSCQVSKSVEELEM